MLCKTGLPDKGFEGRQDADVLQERDVIPTLIQTSFYIGAAIQDAFARQVSFAAAAEPMVSENQWGDLESKEDRGNSAVANENKYVLSSDHQESLSTFVLLPERRIGHSPNSGENEFCAPGCFGGCTL